MAQAHPQEEDHVVATRDLARVKQERACTTVATARLASVSSTDAAWATRQVARGKQPSQQPAAEAKCNLRRLLF